MLYATLTAWGLHRMGDTAITKTKLKEWEQFRGSLVSQANALQQFLGHSMLQMSEGAYKETIRQLRSCYESFTLSESGSTVVVNSKALYHLLPELIPPIDRQYTMRFFEHRTDEWLNPKGKFRQIPLPARPLAQFELFHNTCVKIKRLADQIDPALFEDQRRRYEVTAPKAVDNAIVNFVRTVSAELKKKLPALQPGKVNTSAADITD